MKKNKVVIVTGASRGVGKAVAEILSGKGAVVVLVARSGRLLNRICEDIQTTGGKALSIPADVADPEACRHVIETVIETYGAIDGLVNNAGMVEPISPIETADVAAWQYNIAVNLLAPFYMMRYAMPALKACGGRIVNVSSGAAQHTIAGAGAYCAAKAGLTHLTRVLADEVPEITAVSLRPGVVDTEMQAVIRREGPGAMPADTMSYFQSLKRQGRLVPPQEPARVIAWLVFAAPKSLNGKFLDYDDPELETSAINMGF